MTVYPTDLRMIGLNSLSAQERNVLRHMQAGLVAVDIAAAEYITVNTVRSHIRSILMKLGVSSQLAAVAMANQQRPLKCDTCVHNRVIPYTATMTQTQNPFFVRSFNSPTIHLGRLGRHPGTIVTACNGRTMSGFIHGDAATCKRCAKAVTS